MKQALFILCAAVLLASPLHAETKSIFYSPAELFSDMFAPLMSSGQSVRIQTTLRGFQLFVDLTGHSPDYEVSPTGLFLDVSVRDAEEIPKYTDSTEKKEGNWERRVCFPAPKGETQGLNVHLDYGPNAPEALKDIMTLLNSSIEYLKKRYEKETSRHLEQAPKVSG